MAIDRTWASPLPHAASATAWLDETLLHVEENHHYLRSWRPAVGLPLAINEEGVEPPLLIFSCILLAPSRFTFLQTFLRYETCLMEASKLLFGV